MADEPDERAARLAQALRANLRRRKAQAREAAPAADRNPPSDHIPPSVRPSE